MRTVDKNGDILTETYLDNNDMPVACSGGYATLRNTWDERQRLVKREYLDAEGQPVTLNGSYKDYARFTVPSGTIYYTDAALTTEGGTTEADLEGEYQSATAIKFKVSGEVMPTPTMPFRMPASVV